MSHSCTREDSLPEIESLQRAICLADKLTGIWCTRWNVAKDNEYRTEEKFAFDMYMLTEAVENYLREHCKHLGLDYKFHAGKPHSIAGEEYLDKIWDSETDSWRKGGQDEG